MGEIYSPPQRKNGGFYSVQKVSITFMVSQDFLRFFVVPRRETEKIKALTIHHKGSTNNIQDLRNFAHFAQKTPTRKYNNYPPA